MDPAVVVAFGALALTLIAVPGPDWAFYLVLGHLAGRVLATRPSLTRVATRTAGVAMIVVGVALLVERAVGSL
ncbi:MAG: hypothetical protein ABS81_12915 [Pseudonocardia sp. SCN 72-86]|nr:MAG: hypothetical protein ABS81_12915 [Pseudonocardia sp. SCN 72-86]